VDDIMDYQFLAWAVLLGGLSAASLPLGSVLGLSWQPRNRVIGGMTAFGGGALIAALAIELVAPTAAELVASPDEAAKAVAAHHLIGLLIGAIFGGVLFIALDAIINAQGGFLRKTSSTIDYFTKRQSARRKEILEHLAASQLIRNLPIEIVEEMVKKVNERTFGPGEALCSEGTEGDEVFFIESGTVSVVRGGQEVARLGPGDVLGEIALVTGAPRTATAIAEGTGSALTVQKDHFDLWRSE